MIPLRVVINRQFYEAPSVPVEDLTKAIREIRRILLRRVADQPLAILAEDHGVTTILWSGGAARSH